ncbi:unnamed protein product [Rhizophagus irregularis]|nr:unnamed protein product [Rhizophagus irregularis]
MPTSLYQGLTVLLITLSSQKEALRLLNKDKDQTKELLLFEQELQDVHKDDNNTLEALNGPDWSELRSNSRSDQKIALFQSDWTRPNISVWIEALTQTGPILIFGLNYQIRPEPKQEYITSISNLFTDLNDLAIVEKNMNRLIHNKPTEVDSNTENIAEEITILLNQLNNCEELVKLKNIAFNV